MKARHSFLFPFAVTLALGTVVVSTSHAAELTASDRGASDFFGSSVGISGSTVIVGAPKDDDDVRGADSGSAYIFSDVGGTNTQTKITASDSVTDDRFGFSVGIWGTLMITGSWYDDDVVRGVDSGSAYIFSDVGGTITETKLTAFDGANGDRFGYSVGISGSTAIVGAYSDDDAGLSSGSLYVFSDLGSTNTQTKITAFDGANGDFFGYSARISGGTAIVGAYGDDDMGSNSGSAYVVRDVGSKNIQSKLTASDGAAGDNFGFSVGISGSTAIVGAHLDDDNGSNSGSAYIFGDVEGTNTQTKLTASDGAASDFFGYSVGISGSTAIVTAPQDDDKGSNSGSAYIFSDVGGMNAETKITASDGAATDLFGTSIAIDGDNFVVGANNKDNGDGKAYTGSVSSMTTLDAGNASRTIDGISFVSQGDWIIGESTNGNTVTLGTGDTANVTVGSHAIYIGEGASSDNNTLAIRGNLIAGLVHIGDVSSNEGNMLRLESTATLDAVALIMGENSLLQIEGDYTGEGELLSYLGGTDLRVWNGGTLATLDANNYNNILSGNFDGGYTTFSAIPEPSALLLGLCGTGVLLRRRRA